MVSEHTLQLTRQSGKSLACGRSLMWSELSINWIGLRGWESWDRWWALSKRSSKGSCSSAASMSPTLWELYSWDDPPAEGSASSLSSIKASVMLSVWYGNLHIELKENANFGEPARPRPPLFHPCPRPPPRPLNRENDEVLLVSDAWYRILIAWITNYTQLM